MQEVMAKTGTAARIINKYIEELGDDALHLVTRILIAALILVVGFRIIKHVLKVIRRIMERANVDVTLKTFLISALNIGLKVILVFIAVNELGVTTSSIIAILGSAGIALGLSLQGSLSNIAGGVILLLMKPFAVGDYIYEDASGHDGYVEAIGIMYTRLRTHDNKSIMIPNGQLSAASITNTSSKESRQEDITVGIPYDEDIDKVRAALFEVIDAEEAVIRFQPMEVFVNDFKDSYVEMRIRFWVKTEDYWKCRWRTLENIKKKFDEIRVPIPFNQLDVTLKGDQPFRRD